MILTRKLLVPILTGLMVACGGVESQATVEVVVTRIVQVEKEVTRQTEIEVPVEVTRIVEVPVTVTFTPGPSPTSTVTPTPTVTPTFTPTPTPFRTTGCINLRSVPNFWNLDQDEYATRLYPTYDALDGECVRFFASEALTMVTTDYGWLSRVQGLDFTFTVDEATPSDIRGVPTYSTVWGIWNVKKSGDYEIALRRVDAFDLLQQPIEDDGFYMVGAEWDISAGQWKSLWPPGTRDNCYWARTNPDSGDIRANHFGQAGVYARIYNGDLFESDGCDPWVFVAP